MGQRTGGAGRGRGPPPDRERKRKREPIDGHKFHLVRRRVRAAQRQTEALLTPSTLLLQSAAGGGAPASLDASVSSVGVLKGVGRKGGGLSTYTTTTKDVQTFGHSTEVARALERAKGYG